MIFRVFTFGVAASVGVALGIWTIDREPPIVIIKTEVAGPVPPGGVLKIHYFVKRLRDCAYKVERSLHDSAKVRVILADQDFARPPGPLGDDDYVTDIIIPETFAQGPALYRTVLTYHCNIIHYWFWPIVVGPIEVPFIVYGTSPIPPLPPELRQQFKQP